MLLLKMDRSQLYPLLFLARDGQLNLWCVSVLFLTFGRVSSPAVDIGTQR